MSFQLQWVIIEWCRDQPSTSQFPALIANDVERHFMRLGTSDDTSARFTVRRLAADIVVRSSLWHEGTIWSVTKTGADHHRIGPLADSGCREKVEVNRSKLTLTHTDQGWRAGLPEDRGRQSVTRKKVKK